MTFSGDSVFLMVVVSLFLTLFIFAAWGAPSHYCSLPSVKKVTVPVYPDRVSSSTFTYSFQYFPAEKASSPTIIVVPGGPGVGLIEDWDLKSLKDGFTDFGLPEEAGLIFLDPRTVDCNEGDEQLFPDDALTTEYLAHDIMAAVKKLKLKNYVLYGHSYGSALATVTAGLGQKMGLPPKALVLTGVIGKWARGVEGSVYWGLKTQWNILKARLPEKLVKRFAKSDMPFNFSEDRWTDIIENGLFLGRIMVGGQLVHPLYKALDLIAKNRPEADEEALEIINGLSIQQKLVKNDNGLKWGQRLFEVIDCAELIDIEPTTTLRKGEIVIKGNDCKDRATLIRPYDSRDWPTLAPTFYFAGTSEAVTLYEQARWHFENYKSSNRYLVNVLEGGHNRIGLYFYDCKEALWESMLNEGQGFKQTIETCRATRLMCQNGACRQKSVVEYLPGNP